MDVAWFGELLTGQYPGQFDKVVQLESPNKLLAENGQLPP
jgi:hypothetical protein